MLSQILRNSQYYDTIGYKFMSDLERTPSAIHPALERAERIERALSHTARALELELADIELAGQAVDETVEQSLRSIGATLIRISQMGINTANSLAATIGTDQIALDVPTTLLEQPSVTSAVQAMPKTPEQPNLQPAVGTQPRAQEPQAAAVKTEAAPAELVVKGEEPVAEPQKVASISQVETREKKTPAYEGELYTRIVPESVTPIMELRKGMIAIPLRIVTDDTVIINGEKVMLEGDQLFIFNALMKLRDNLIAAKDMRKLGFRLEGQPGAIAFSQAMRELTSQLQQAAGPELPTLIKRTGKAAGTKYAVNPAIVLQDERIVFGDDETGESEIVKKK